MKGLRMFPFSPDTVYALHGCNASNELLCMENIDMYVNNRCMPLLDSLLCRLVVLSVPRVITSRVIGCYQLYTSLLMP